MNKLKIAIKETLIRLQQEGKLPANMADLDTAIFDPVIQQIEETFTTLHKSCQQAIDGTWNMSADGFEAMQNSIEEHVDIDYEGPIYQDDEDDDNE